MYGYFGNNFTLSDPSDIKLAICVITVLFKRFFFLWHIRSCNEKLRCLVIVLKPESVNLAIDYLDLNFQTTFQDFFLRCLSLVCIYVNEFSELAAFLPLVSIR